NALLEAFGSSQTSRTADREPGQHQRSLVTLGRCPTPRPSEGSSRCPECPGGWRLLPSSPPCSACSPSPLLPPAPPAPPCPARTSPSIGSATSSTPTTACSP